jgi:hypothetical protein
MASSVELLHAVVEQRPVSQVLTGVTTEELVPVRKMETRGEGLMHAAEGLDAIPASALRHPDDRVCLS